MSTVTNGEWLMKDSIFGGTLMKEEEDEGKKKRSINPASSDIHVISILHFDNRFEWEIFSYHCLNIPWASNVYYMVLTVCRTKA